jgi:phage shock protein C
MTQYQPPTPYPPTGRRLVRSRQDRWVAGVCGGVAAYTGIDVNLVRLFVVLGTVLGFGSLFIAYIVAWILMPQE